MHPSTPALDATFLGRQVTAEYYGCDAALLASPERIEALMREAAMASGATIVEAVFHHFNPHGVSGAVIIAESHLAIHTWPEHGYAAVDVFTCGETVDPAAAVEHLAAGLKASRHTAAEVRRGDRALIDGLRG